MASAHQSGRPPPAIIYSRRRLEAPSLTSPRLCRRSACPRVSPLRIDFHAGRHRNLAASRLSLLSTSLPRSSPQAAGNASSRPGMASAPAATARGARPQCILDPISSALRPRRAIIDCLPHPRRQELCDAPRRCEPAGPPSSPGRVLPGGGTGSDHQMTAPEVPPPTRSSRGELSASTGERLRAMKRIAATADRAAARASPLQGRVKLFRAASGPRHRKLPDDAATTNAAAYASDCGPHGRLPARPPCFDRACRWQAGPALWFIPRRSARYGCFTRRTPDRPGGAASSRGALYTRQGTMWPSVAGGADPRLARRRRPSSRAVSAPLPRRDFL